jgi:hypothetical protein
MIVIEQDCNGPVPGGFFSKFLIVLDWVHNSIYKKEKVYVDWSCKKTLDYNLWELFFEQPNLIEDETDRHVNIFHYRHENRNLVYENIDKHLPMFTAESYKVFNKIELLKKDNFQIIRDEFHKAWKLINVKSDILNSISNLESKITENTLGVTVRAPIHYCYDHNESNPLSNNIKPETFYDSIMNELIHKVRNESYDNLFIACDVQYFIDLAKSVFGPEKVIHTEYKRVQNLNHDWVEKKIALKDEYEFILKDALLLSKCNNIIGGCSNIFTGVLLINNKSNFQIFEILKHVTGR